MAGDRGHWRKTIYLFRHNLWLKHSLLITVYYLFILHIYVDLTKTIQFNISKISVSMYLTFNQLLHLLQSLD